MWKVYNIQSGQIIKGGFGTEDSAKEWMELRRDLADDDHDVDEMDEEEEEEYSESGGTDDYDPGADHIPEPLYDAEDDSPQPQVGSSGTTDVEEEFADEGYSVLEDEDY